MNLTEIRANLRTRDAFSDTSDAVLDALAAVAQPMTFKPGEALMSEGDDDRDLVVVVAGRVHVTRADDANAPVVLRALSGGVLGEMQFLMRGKRSASVVAAEPVVALRLPSGDVERLALEHPALLETLAEHMRIRRRQNRLRAALTARYGTLDARAVDALLDAAAWLRVDAGAHVIRQGDPSDALFVLLHGRLMAVHEAPDGATTRLGEIGPGETVGETALVGGGQRSAGIWALQPCELAKVDAEDFVRIANQHPSLWQRLLEVTLTRQAHNAPRRMRQAHSVALLPLGHVRLDAFTAQLLAEADDPARVALVTPERVRARFAPHDLTALAHSDPAMVRLDAWLEALEADHDLVLYQADALGSPWAAHCASMAEEVVLVGRARNPEPPSRAEARTLASCGVQVAAPRTTLVVLHPNPNAQAPTHTRAWRRGRTLDAIVHVRDGHAPDFARALRLMRHSAVGVVLGGGAARSFASVGVLRAMDALGIPVDAICGVSAGAVVAALYADELHLTRPFMSKLMRDFVLSGPSIALHTAGLTSNASIDRMVQRLFGPRDLEDLWRPCFFVSTNLTRAEQRVSDRGPLLPGLLASNAMPGLLPPVAIDGDLHVDGAFLNNVPIAEMAQAVRGGPVIAVDVTPSVEFDNVTPSKRTGSALSGLLSRVRGAADASNPNLIEVLLRSQLLNHVAHLRHVKPLAALYLTPDVKRFSLVAYTSHAAIAQAGYDQCKPALERWWSAERQRA